MPTPLSPNYHCLSAFTFDFSNLILEGKNVKLNNCNVIRP